MMRFVVIGGGIAGLAAALRLRRLATAARVPGVETVLVEQAGRLGGKLHTAPVPDLPELCSVETGAEAFLMWEHGAPSRALELARSLGLEAELIHPATLPAAIAVPDGLRPIPSGTLFGIPSDPSIVESLAGISGHDYDTGEPVLSSAEDIAVGELVRRRFGDEVVERLVDPMLGGVYAGRADDLSLEATMPALHAAARSHRTLAGAVSAALAHAPRPPGSPVFAAVSGGLGRLVDATAEASRARICLGRPLRDIEPRGGGWRLTLGATRDPEHLTADGVIVAVPARPAARLLRRVAPDAATEIAVLDYASVALVTLVLPAGVRLPRFSGVLVPAFRGFSIKAATFVSAKWPQRSDSRVVVRVSLGRYGDEAVLQAPDEALIEVAHRELGEVLGSALPAPLAARVNRWGGALPQYGVGHVARVARARAVLPRRIALAGAAYDGVGIAACVRSGENAAEAVWHNTVESDPHE